MDTSNEKRVIPFDQPIKLTLLIFHFIGFAGWYGSVAQNVPVNGIFISLVSISGLLLILREVYKETITWFRVTEGTLTLLKLVVIGLASLLPAYQLPLLTVVIVCGVLSAHLPGNIKDKPILRVLHIL